MLIRELVWSSVNIYFEREIVRYSMIFQNLITFIITIVVTLNIFCYEPCNEKNDKYDTFLLKV